MTKTNTSRSLAELLSRGQLGPASKQGYVHGSIPASGNRVNAPMRSTSGFTCGSTAASIADARIKGRDVGVTTQRVELVRGQHYCRSLVSTWWFMQPEGGVKQRRQAKSGTVAGSIPASGNKSVVEINPKEIAMQLAGKACPIWHRRETVPAYAVAATAERGCGSRNQIAGSMRVIPSVERDVYYKPPANVRAPKTGSIPVHRNN